MAPILGLSLRRYAAGLYQAPHVHDVHSVTLVLKGRLRETVDGTEERAAPLSLVVKPAGVPHADRFGPEGVVTCQILIDPRHDRRRWDPALGRWRWIEGGPIVRAALEVTHLLVVAGPSSRAAHKAAGAMLDVLAEVRSRNAPPPPWLKRAMEHLRDRVDSGDAPVRMRDAARAAGVHPVHLARVFRSHHGCATSAWTRWARIRRAAEHLADGNLSLAAVAAESGFADQSHMNRVFRRETGLMPRAFQKIAGQL